jgi:hypothetical protein
MNLYFLLFFITFTIMSSSDNQKHILNVVILTNSRLNKHKFFLNPTDDTLNIYHQKNQFPYKTIKIIKFDNETELNNYKQKLNNYKEELENKIKTYKKTNNKVKEYQKKLESKIEKKNENLNDKIFNDLIRFIDKKKIELASTNQSNKTQILDKENLQQQQELVNKNNSGTSTGTSTPSKEKFDTIKFNNNHITQKLNLYTQNNETINCYSENNSTSSARSKKTLPQIKLPYNTIQKKYIQENQEKKTSFWQKILTSNNFFLNILRYWFNF